MKILNRNNLIVIAVIVLTMGITSVHAALPIPTGQFAPDYAASLDESTLFTRGGSAQFIKYLTFDNAVNVAGAIFNTAVAGQWTAFEDQAASLLITQLANIQGNVFIGADIDNWGYSVGSGFGAFNAPVERLNVAGSILSENIATGTGKERLCVTHDGTLTNCDNVGTQ